MDAKIVKVIFIIQKYDKKQLNDITELEIQHHLLLHFRTTKQQHRFAEPAISPAPRCLSGQYHVQPDLSLVPSPTAAK